MTNQPTHPDHDPASGLPIPLDGGTTDLGDDTYRDAANRGSVLGDQPREGSGPADVDAGSGLAVEIDPGTTDLGDDATRDASDR